MEDKVSLPITFYRMNQDEKFVEIVNYLLANYNTFAGDFLITFGRALTFLKDEKFLKTLLSHPDSQAQTLAWRLHTACWAAKRALNLSGDFVECGVERAITSTQITNYLNFNTIDKHFYLYDTFGGIPDSYQNEHDDPLLNNYDKNADENYSKVCDRFNDYKNVHVIKGALPEVLKTTCPEKISFLHLDLGNFPSEHDTLKILIDKIVPGGIVLFQSFGFMHFGCHQMVNSPFITERNIPILELPTGQGLLIV